MSEVQKALEELATPPAQEPDEKPALEAQKTAADLDREEQRARTVYVLMRRAEDPGVVGVDAVWHEIARIPAASREAAWEEAKRTCPVVVPEPDGEDELCQLIPERFFKQIRSYNRQPPPQPGVEGL